MEEEANTTQRRKQLTKTQQNKAICAQVGFCVSLSPVCPVCCATSHAEAQVALRDHFQNRPIASASWDLAGQGLQHQY